MNNIEEIIKRMKNNSEEQNRQLAKELTQNLSQGQNDALSRLLSDKALVTKLMNTPEAQEILKKMGGDKNGHQ
ncbi:MAG: hypothetical protein IJ289_01050 [Clostridia bacterium]|nr:hypothetical protein [Clostridia bacterium]